MDGTAAGYSRLQITLHWLVVILVIFQFVAHDGMEHVWDAYERGREIGSGDVPLAYAHIAAGAAILMLALWRLWLRMTVGAPGLPDSHPAIVRLAAVATHWALYALLILTPLSGSAAWFLGVDAAGDAHKVLKTLLLFVAVLHVVGALVEHFVLRSDVMKRMLRPAS